MTHPTPIDQAGPAPPGAPPSPVRRNPLSLCRRVDFPVAHDYRGNLSFIEGGRDIPFDIRRIYYLYDVPSGAERAGHAHRNLTQVFISMSGSFDLCLDDGVERRVVQLNRSHQGFVVYPWVWRVVNNFSGNAVCLVLADAVYSEDDYIRDFSEFRSLAAPRNGAAA